MAGAYDIQSALASLGDGGTEEYWTAYYDDDNGRHMLDNDAMPPTRDKSLALEMFIEYADAHDYSILENTPENVGETGTTAEAEK